MNLKEKVALVYARKQNLSARTRWRTTVLFLAFLIPGLAGKAALAQDQPGADYALVIDLYSGVVESGVTQEKAFSLWLERLKKSEEPYAGGVPKVIHIEHPLSDKDFDLAAQAEANGQKVVVQGHVGRQADGKYKITFSQLGRPPGYSEAIEIRPAPGERWMLPLPVIRQPDGQGNLVTLAVIWTPALAKDQNGHSLLKSSNS